MGPSVGGPMLPREHGSWALLFVPLIVGVGAARGGPPAAVLALFAAALGGFLIRVPLQAWLSGAAPAGTGAWFVGYGALAVAGLAPLLLRFGRWGLLAFAVPIGALMCLHLWNASRRRAMTLANELGGVLGLSLGAPAAYYACSGALDAAAWSAWAATAAYLFAPVFHVKLAAARHRASASPSFAGDLASAARASMAYHSAAAAAALAAAASGLMPWAVAPAFLASWVKAWRLARLGPGRMDFKRLGWGEVAHAAFFSALTAAGYAAF